MIASVFLRRTERGTITVSEEREGSGQGSKLCSPCLKRMLQVKYTRQPLLVGKDRKDSLLALISLTLM